MVGTCVLVRWGCRRCGPCQPLLWQRQVNVPRPATSQPARGIRACHTELVPGSTRGRHMRCAAAATTLADIHASYLRSGHWSSFVYHENLVRVIQRCSLALQHGLRRNIRRAVQLFSRQAFGRQRLGMRVGTQMPTISCHAGVFAQGPCPCSVTNAAPAA